MAKSKTSHDTLTAESVGATQGEPVPQEPAPIDGLKPGRIVHVLSSGKTRAAMVTEVYDAVTGDIAAYVFEPVAPPHPARLVFAGKGEQATEDKTWAWMYEGQATRGNAV
jgi:hypothetical protein